MENLGGLASGSALTPTPGRRLAATPGRSDDARVWRRLFPETSHADTSIVLDMPVAVAVLAEWTFHRGQDVLVLSRERTDQGYQLVVTERGRPRTFGFIELDRLIAFQQDMEAFLVRTGWALTELAPVGPDRDDR